MTSLLLPLPLLVTSDAATGGSGEVAASPVARLGLNLPSVAELQRPTALYSETEASAAPAGQAPGGGEEWVVVVEVEVGVWGRLGVIVGVNDRGGVVIGGIGEQGGEGSRELRVPGFADEAEYADQEEGEGGGECHVEEGSRKVSVRVYGRREKRE
ncbi:hypothetical protein ACFX13_010542 [Malus domestica]